MPTAKHHESPSVPLAHLLKSESVIDETGHVRIRHVVSDEDRRAAGSILLERLRTAPVLADGKSGADLLAEARNERSSRHGI
jgi:hypothetical protein